jgi:zinc protease
MLNLFKRSLILFAVSLLISLTFHGSATAQSQKPRSFHQLDYPPLPSLQLPAYARYQLPNGLVVYLMEDHRLPLVRGNAIFRAGSRWEPSEKVGLASLTGITMRTGGTTTSTPRQLNQALEERAASIETGIGVASGSVSFDALSKDQAWIIERFADVIQNPAFNPEQVQLAQTQLRGAIARRDDEPRDIASRELGKLIYGADSPYARTIEYATLDRIDREDLINFHQTYVRPEQMIIGIVGDFEAASMKELIAQHFGSWQGSKAEPNLKPPGAQQSQAQKIFMIDRPHLSQSNVLLGQIGGEINSPDYAALTVMNGVLNGFGGRLFNNIRTQKGLAYSVSGRWQPGFDYPGTFVAGGQTRTETTSEFIEALKTEIKRLREQPITEKELAYAKESILNSFIFNFEKPSQSLSRLMTYEYYGYPQDFIFDYQKRVKAVTKDDVQRVARKYLNPDRLVTVVVGNGEAVLPDLSKLQQPVQKLDISTREG